MVTVELKSLPVQRIAQVSAQVARPENIAPVIGPLYGSLAQHLSTVGIEFGPFALATYEMLDSGINISAAFPVSTDVVEGGGFDIVELPSIDLAATTVHHGSMATIGETWESMMLWVSENGYEPVGISREVYLVSDPKPEDEWVTEIQQPIVRA